MERSPAPERVAAVALAITAVLAVVKVAIGLATSSLAILSQALDTAVDLVAIGLVLIAVRLAGKPADESHHYGHGKAENLVAFTQTLLLGAVVLGLVAEAARRLGARTTDLDIPWYAIAVLAVSAVVDAGRATWLLRTARAHGSEALRAGALNFATDVGTAVVALASVVLVRTGNDKADAIGALIVSVAVVAAAYRLGRRSVDVLMDRSPRARADAIEAAVANAPGVNEARRVRVRGSGEQLFADVTVATGRTVSLERAHDVAEAVEEEISRVAPGTDVVVHVEPVAETSSLVERVQAAASRASGVREVHNVLVHTFEDVGGTKLHVTLHAKADAALSIVEAHDLADRVEAQVAAELGDDVRVDTHIEPLEQAGLGKDVTEERDDVVRSIQALATEEDDILDCHEVLVTQTGEELSVVAHVRGRGSLSLSRLHAASQRIENAIHARHPDIGPVLIHFEPEGA
ncbi:MAG TPA: cation-efflux pump [Actinomycetota bacterium]|nr:cation-efflux pump [Actinomycetota bacterium]